MGNIIVGLIAMLIITLFLGGLALSIGSIPFGIIVIVVLAMALVDFVQTVRGNG